MIRTSRIFIGLVLLVGLTALAAVVWTSQVGETQANNAPSLSATVDEWKVDLVLSSGPNPWWFRFGGGSCTQVSGTTVSGISGYQPSTYNIVAYSDSGCANQIAATSVTIPTASLAATVNQQKVDLVLSDGPNPWWFRFGGGSCTQVSGTTVSGISGYQPSTYSIVAYSDGGCGKQIANTWVTVPVPPPSLTATVTSDQSVDLALSHGPGSWWYKTFGTSGSCTSASGTAVNDLTGYPVGTHTITAYSDSACNSQIASASFTIAHTHTLDVSVIKGELYLRPSPAHNGDWWYQVDSGSCAKAPSRNHGPVASMSAGSSHTATAFRDNGCVTAMSPTNSFTVPSLSATVAGDQSVDLVLSDFPKDSWWYNGASGSCTAATGTTVSGLSGYQGGTHTVTAYAQNNCTYWIATTTFTITTPTLTATRNADWSVDLNLSGGPDNWWFRINNGACTAASGTAVNGIAGYRSGIHSVNAYSNNGCNHWIDSASFTIPTASLTATVQSDQSVDLSLSNGPDNWWFRINWGACTAVSVTAVNGIAGYQPGAYSVKAYSNNGCNYRVTATSFTIS